MSAIIEWMMLPNPGGWVLLVVTSAIALRDIAAWIGGGTRRSKGAPVVDTVACGMCAYLATQPGNLAWLLPAVLTGGLVLADIVHLGRGGGRA